MEKEFLRITGVIDASVDDDAVLESAFPTEFDKVTLDGGFVGEREFGGGSAVVYHGETILPLTHETAVSKGFPILFFAGGFVLGFAAATIFDQASGRSRRARMRDKLVRLSHEIQARMGRKARDLGHRAQGLGAKVINNVLVDDKPDDRTLVARVRSAIGHHVSHARSIRVEADKGIVTLSGPILAREVAELFQTVKSVRGVKEIKNSLRVFESKDHVPGLQGVSRIEKWQQ